MARGKFKKDSTAAGAASAAREARIATVEYMRNAPIARNWQAQMMLAAFQVKVVHLRDQVDLQAAQAAAAGLLFTGMGYPETWRPKNWEEAAETVLSDEARYMAEADLYIMSPQMCGCDRGRANTHPRRSQPDQRRRPSQPIWAGHATAPVAG